MASSTKSKIIKAAGKRGKTKAQLAEAVNIGYSQAAKVVNELAFEASEPTLFFIGKSKSGADLFANADPASSSSSSSSSSSRSSSK